MGKVYLKRKKINESQYDSKEQYYKNNMFELHRYLKDFNSSNKSLITILNMFSEQVNKGNITLSDVERRNVQLYFNFLKTFIGKVSDLTPLLEQYLHGV